MTPEQLAEIEDRANAATAGPWFRDRDRDRTVFSVSDGMIGGVLYNTNGAADADFIAHTRQDIPALIAAVRERDAEIERVKADMTTWRKLAAYAFTHHWTNLGGPPASDLPEWSVTYWEDIGLIPILPPINEIFPSIWEFTDFHFQQLKEIDHA